MSYCLPGSNNACSHVRSIHVWEEGVPRASSSAELSSRRRGHKAAGGTAVRSGGDVEPCSCQARSDAPCSRTSCHPLSSGIEIFPLPLLVAGEPLGMLMPYPVISGKLLPHMNTELCFELGSVGSFPALIRRALGLGLGFVFPLLFIPGRPICSSEPTPKAPAG